MSTRFQKIMDGIKSTHSQVQVFIDQIKPKEGHYQGRYEAYLREGIIEPKLNGIFFDEYDELPGTVYVTVEGASGRAVAGVRIKVLDDAAVPSISTQVYGTAVTEAMDPGSRAIDVSRMFTLKEDDAMVSYLQFCLMRAIFKCAETYNARYILAPVKAGHVSFYKNFFRFELVSEPIEYPGLSRPIGLTCCDVKANTATSSAMPFLADDFPGVAANDFPRQLEGVG